MTFAVYFTDYSKNHSAMLSLSLPITEDHQYQITLLDEAPARSTHITVVRSNVSNHNIPSTPNTQTHNDVQDRPAVAGSKLRRFTRHNTRLSEELKAVVTLSTDGRQVRTALTPSVTRHTATCHVICQSNTQQSRTTTNPTNLFLTNI